MRVQSRTLQYVGHPATVAPPEEGGFANGLLRASGEGLRSSWEGLKASWEGLRASGAAQGEGRKDGWTDGNNEKKKRRKSPYVMMP